jgi:hypothetical protein
MHERLEALVNRLPPGRWRRFASIGAGLWLLWILAGFLLVPWIVRRQVIGRAAETLHRQATVAKVRFNPFTLETRLIGFALQDRDNTPLAAFDTLLINVELASAIHRALVLKEFRVVRPVLTARIMPDGRPAIADLFEQDSAAATPRDTTPKAPPRLKVRLFSVSAGTVTFVDESRAPRYTELFEDLGLTLEGFSTLPREEGDHILTVSFATGAELRWSGTVVMQPLTLAGRIGMSGLVLPRLSRVLGDRFPLAITQGRGAATFDYLVDQAPDGALQVVLRDGSIDLTDIAMRPPAAESDWVRVALVEASGLRLAWPQRAAALDLLRVTGPWVAATRLADSTIDWMPIFEALRPGDSARVDSGPPWSGMLTALEIAGGGAHLVDRTVRPAAVLDLSAITVRLDSIRTDPATRIGVEASASVGPKTTFVARGGMTREPFTADLDVALAGLELPRAQPYLGESPPISLTSGRASVSGKVRVQPGKPATTFEGSASIGGLEVVTPDGGRLIAWESTRFKGIRVTTAPDLARIRSIEVVKPFIRVAITRDQQVNLSALAALMPADTTRPTFPYEVVEVSIKDAEVDFEDLSLILPFRTRIHSATGSLKDVASFGGTPGSLEFEGMIDDNGRARATGSIHLSDPYAATEINADFRNVSLPTLSPYSLEFAGYPVTRGTLDLALEYRIQDKKLTANHHIVASDLELGEKAEGGAMPGFAVKLALSLLKDSQGKIKLDALVEGTVDDPQFRYSEVVWQVLKQMLGKIATAPFRFLGNLLGIGGDDVELVDFDPGRADVIPPEKQKLDTLAAELGRRPELTISVEGRYDSISDVEAIREAQLRALIEARREGAASATKRQDTTATALGAILEALYVAQFSKPGLDSLRASFAADSTTTKYFTELRGRLLAAQPVAPGALEQLGRDRAAAVAGVLLARGTMDSSRVTATDPAPVQRKKAGSSRVPSEMSMDAH